MENIQRSTNWWAFLSGYCSFKRRDIMRVNGFDPFFEGWGGADNELGYRVVLNGMDIVYTQNPMAFEIWQDKNLEERYRSVLTNIDYMCRKFPELRQFEPLVARKREVEDWLKGHESKGNARFSRGENIPD